MTSDQIATTIKIMERVSGPTRLPTRTQLDNAGFDPAIVEGCIRVLEAQHDATFGAFDEPGLAMMLGMLVALAYVEVKDDARAERINS